MASWICGAGDEQPAAYLITDLSNDTTTAMCGPHMADFALAYVQAWSEAIAPDDTQPELTPEPEAIDQAASDDTDDEQAADIRQPVPGSRIDADPEPHTPPRRTRTPRTAKSTS